MKYEKSSRTIKLLETLAPEAKEAISAMLELGYKAGLNPQVHSAYRSPAEQDALYAQGRTKPGKIITNAKGTPVAQSMHCYKLAVDIHFDQNQDSIAEWDEAHYKKLWDLAVEAGLDKKGLFWSGLWTGGMREAAHFDMSSGRSWKEFANGAKVQPPAASVAAPPAKKTKK